ncbi:hypothetical protein [Streptomyces sp. NPDC006997]|uniref:hypothetical protein n=1 Tax=Streptomyces sp. NPDC006997 TaxID=3155356 RepID=UPI003408D3F0
MAERQRQHGRADGTLVVAALMAGLWTTATACSGGAAAEDAKATTPLDTLRQAADTLREAGTSRTRTSMEMATGGTRVTISGTGVYDFAHQRGRLRVVLPQDPAGRAADHPITELLSPGALFMKNRGAGVPSDKWVRIDTATISDGNLVTGGATDPYTAAEVLRGARQAKYAGTTTAPDGTRLTHYRGTADLTQAAKAASPATRPSLAAAAKGFASARVPFDAFLDDRGRIRKLEHRFSFVNGRERSPVSVTSTTLLYDFGAPAHVELPPDKDIYAGRIAED